MKSDITADTNRNANQDWAFVQSFFCVKSTYTFLNTETG